jgi:pyruvate dehydrogenase (quinone)
MKVGDFVVERLRAWGVRRIYGYPGDGINGVIGALQRAGNIEFVQVRHEEMAAFMAVAHAKFTGELGVCLSTGGPGATHLITGLYDAKLDHAPVLAICGQAEAPVTSKRSTWTACSPTSQASCKRLPRRRRYGTFWTDA